MCQTVWYKRIKVGINWPSPCSHEHLGGGGRVQTDNKQINVQCQVEVSAMEKPFRQSEGEESAEADVGRGAMITGWLGKNPPRSNI